MTSGVVTCDQAVFTSIRTPTGEGYRIIAASRGLRADEKQSITRNSPSHDALCSPSTASSQALAAAAAFYALPSGRLCVAYSCHAGSEHTGRGGQRVYTQNVVFDEKAFESFGFNAFQVVRAMEGQALTTPRLSPPASLPELSIPTNPAATSVDAGALNSALNPAQRRAVLALLLDCRGLILDVADRWLEAAETLLLGIPGPMRTRISFSAGLRYSVNRGHRLQLLRDEKGAARTRTAGQGLAYLGPSYSTVDVYVAPSEWISFVERQWERNRIAELARRTSPVYEDCSAPVRERFGRLLNVIDTVEEVKPGPLLKIAAQCLFAAAAGREKALHDEVAAVTQTALHRRLQGAPLPAVKEIWSDLLALRQRQPLGTRFADPLVVQTLRTALAIEPLEAASLALEAAKSNYPADRTELHQVLSSIIERLASLPPRDNSERARFNEIARRWIQLRSGDPAVERLRERVSAPEVCMPRPS